MLKPMKEAAACALASSPPCAQPAADATNPLRGASRRRISESEKHKKYGNSKLLLRLWAFFLLVMGACPARVPVSEYYAVPRNTSPPAPQANETTAAPAQPSTPPKPTNERDADEGRSARYVFFLNENAARADLGRPRISSLSALSPQFHSPTHHPSCRARVRDEHICSWETAVEMRQPRGGAAGSPGACHQLRTPLTPRWTGDRDLALQAASGHRVVSSLRGYPSSRLVPSPFSTRGVAADTDGRAQHRVRSGHSKHSTEPAHH